MDAFKSIRGCVGENDYKIVTVDQIDVSLKMEEEIDELVNMGYEKHFGYGRVE